MLAFNQNGYRFILEYAIKASYNFISFDEVFSFTSKSMLIRHDIDFSLDFALKTAQLENSLGIKGTYFILLYNDFYNPLSPSNRAKIKSIVNYGHEIGLHWDSTIYKSLEHSGGVEDAIKKDLDILADISESQITCASQHVPIDSPALDIRKYIKHEAYDPKIRERLAYISDSNMAWRNLTPINLIDSEESFQFLSHPIWWMTDGDNIKDKVDELIRINSESGRHSLTEARKYMEYCLQNRADLDAAFKKRRAEKQ